MPKRSAGLVVYRHSGGGLEILLVHPGGPYWAGKDLGAWSIPKGEPAPNEDCLTAAQREFTEETGCTVTGEFTALAPIKQAGGKVVEAWAVEGQCDPSRLRSNAVMLEWPPHSGELKGFPEVDRAAWFPLPEARRRILPSQRAFLAQLDGMLSRPRE